MQRSQSTVVATFASGSIKMADAMENHGKFRCDISFDSFNFDQIFFSQIVSIDHIVCVKNPYEHTVCI